MRTERLVAASGAAYVVAIMVGSGMANPGSGTVSSGPAILAHVRAGHTPAESAGIVLEVLGFALLLVFLGYLYRMLRRGEGPGGWAATAALGAGVAATAIKLNSATPVMAAYFRGNVLTPDLARTLDDLGGTAFVVSGYVYGIFVALAAWSAFGSRVLPRWLSISGLVVGVLTIAAGTAGVLDPAGYIPVPFLLCLAWVLIASIVWAVRQPQPVTPERATKAVPAEVSASA